MTQRTEKQENLSTHETGQLHDAKAKVTQMLELSNRL